MAAIADVSTPGAVELRAAASRSFAKASSTSKENPSRIRCTRRCGDGDGSRRRDGTEAFMFMLMCSLYGLVSGSLKLSTKEAGMLAGRISSERRISSSFSPGGWIQYVIILPAASSHSVRNGLMCATSYFPGRNSSDRRILWLLFEFE
jgi:hypothetical protein